MTSYLHLLTLKQLWSSVKKTNAFSWSNVSRVLGRSFSLQRGGVLKTAVNLTNVTHQKEKQSPNQRRASGATSIVLPGSCNIPTRLNTQCFRWVSGGYTPSLRIRLGWDWNSESYSENGFRFLLSDIGSISKSIRFYLLNTFLAEIPRLTTVTELVIKCFPNKRGAV